MSDTGLARKPSFLDRIRVTKTNSAPIPIVETKPAVVEQTTTTTTSTVPEATRRISLRDRIKARRQRKAMEKFQQ